MSWIFNEEFKNRTYRCTLPKWVTRYKNGKKWHYGNGNAKGQVPLSYFQHTVGFPSEWYFNNLENVKSLFKHWIEWTNEYEALCRSKGETYLNSNPRVTFCKVLKDKLIIKWAHDVTDEKFLKEIESEPYTVSFKMVITDVKKNLQDFNEIPKT